MIVDASQKMLEASTERWLKSIKIDINRMRQNEQGNREEAKKNHI